MFSETATRSGIDRFAAHARIAEVEERQRLYDAQAAGMPIVVLEPRP
jgi:hypothetical protein